MAKTTKRGDGEQRHFGRLAKFFLNIWDKFRGVHKGVTDRTKKLNNKRKENRKARRHAKRTKGSHQI